MIQHPIKVSSSGELRPKNILSIPACIEHAGKVMLKQKQEISALMLYSQSAILANCFYSCRCQQLSNRILHHIRQGYQSCSLFSTYKVMSRMRVWLWKLYSWFQKVVQ